MPAPKQRSSNLELLRIIAQLAIIAYHLANQSVIKSFPHDSIRAFSALFLGSFGPTGVNVFIIIGSWFLIDLPFRSIRFVKLYLATWIYTVTVTLAVLFLNLNPKGVSGKDLFYAFTPFTSCELWFISSYLFLLLIAPFLNRLIRTLPADKYRVLYYILLVVFVFLPTFDGMVLGSGMLKTRTMIKSDLLTMIALYVIVGYWKKIKEPFFAKRNGALYCVIFLVAGIALLRIAECFGGNIPHAKYLFRKSTAFAQYAVWDLGSIFCFGLASSSFFLFRSFSFSSPVINRIAKNILGVYVLHQIPCLYPVMWSWFHIEKWWDTPYYLLGELGVVAAVFAGCWLIECLREWMMRPLYRTKWMQRFLAKADSLFQEEKES